MKNVLPILFLFVYSTSCSQLKTDNSFFVKTGDSLAYLNYGLGTDRLGGAKMTFLDSNIVLKVVDSIGAEYKVQLSEYHSAYIDKKLVREMPPFNAKNHLTGSWSVKGDSLFDYVSIALDEKLPYKSEMQIQPTRIVIDLYGATSNTNWITQLSTAKEIKNVWYEQTEDDVMRVFIELKHSQDWGYKIFYTNNNVLTIRVKRQPPILNIANLTIAVDAGHGGEQTGTEGFTKKVLEKDYTLLIAKEVQQILLEKKAKVIMTREKDTTLSMYERINFLNAQNPDLLVSIHLNSSSNERISGISTYYRYIGFRPLSQSILSSMLMLGLNEFGNVGSFNFALNGPTDFPNALVEVAFLTNREDEKKILDPLFRKEVAMRIVEGIENFLKNP